MSNETYEDRLSALRETVPAPQHQAENRAAFLARAAEIRAGDVSKIPVARHNGVKGGHLHMTTNSMPVSRRFAFAFRLALVAVIALVFAFVVSPDVRTLAQQIIQYFTHVEDVMPAEVYVPADAYHDFNESRANPASFQTAIAAASFPVLLPSEMPESYQPYRAVYDAESEFLRLEYRCSSNLIEFSQYPKTSPMNNGWDIGESAVIVHVTIDGLPGEYVQGSWTYDMPPSELREGLPSHTVTTTRKWTNDPSASRLFWMSENMVYTFASFSSIRSTECQLSQDIFVSIAESLQ